MVRRRLGCLTNTGLLAVALTLLLILGVTVVRGGRLFSPGPLNAQTGDTELGAVRSHAETGGQCNACHTAPWDRASMAARCLDCHTGVADQLADPSTLHGALKGEEPDLDCRGCHTEHGGATASLTDTDMTAFPHERVGYSLAGHGLHVDGSPFVCADCHTETVARFDLDTCTVCHFDLDQVYMQAHGADFGQACLECHDGVDRYGQDSFDHNLLDFPLTGKHVEAACSGCHIDARSVADLQSAPGDCVACHQQDDAHDGNLGSDCAACHNSDDWQDATFDHAQSAFPLTGQHLEVECVECHIDRVFQGTPTDCVACHQQDDAHDGNLGSDCAACHNSEDWQDATFDHNLSAFPLTGQHLEVECVECHIDRVFQGTPTDCVACHQQDDAHDGNLGSDCAACHNSEDWQDATFDHNLSAFPLTGQHVEVECVECHIDRVFQGTPTDCVACHQDPDFHLAAFGVACADCHTTAAWQPARFDDPHTFPFDHGEEGVSSCQTCHVTQVQTYTCYTCHEHNEEEIRDDHLDEGIQDFANCVDCHPTGLEEEGEHD